MEEPVCPACGNNIGISRMYKKFFKDGDLLKCKVCDLCFLWPPPEVNATPQIYKREYYDAWSADNLGNDGLANMKMITFDRVLGTIERFKNIGTLLDVGCALGHLLESAKKRGWDVYGVEISEYSSEEARKRIGNNKVITGDFLDSTFPKGHFDVITMIDIIEHVYNTGDLLKKCHDLLKPDGLLVIVTPNIGGLLHKCLRRYWPHFNNAHVTYFSPKSVHAILELKGFRPSSILNFKKALNFYYIRGVIRAHCRRPLIFLADVFNILIPPTLKRKNIFLSHGEVIVIAHKK